MASLVPGEDLLIMHSLTWSRRDTTGCAWTSQRACLRHLSQSGAERRRARAASGANGHLPPRC